MPGAIGGFVGEITGSSDAAKGQQRATDAQLQSVRESNDLLREFNEQARTDNAPYLQAGYSGLNRLLYGLGLGGSANGAATAGTSPQLTEAQLREQLSPQFTQQGNPATPPDLASLPAQVRAAIQQGGGTYGYDARTGKYGYNYNESTYNGDNGESSQNRWFYADQVPGGQSTVDEAGLNAAIQQRLQQQQSQATAGATGGAGFGNLLAEYKPYEAFSAEKFQVDPSYQWRLNQGNNALTQSLASGGNLNSGRALKALTDYNQGAASQEYGAAYNRYNNDYTTGFNAFNTNQSNQYNKLMGLVGVGTGANAQNAAGNLATGQQLAGNAIQGGNAAAAGAVAQGNSTANGFNSLLGIAGLGLGAYGAFGGSGALGRTQGVTSYGIRT